MHGSAFHPMRGPYFYHYCKDGAYNGDLDLLVDLATYSVILSLFVFVYLKIRPKKMLE